MTNLPWFLGNTNGFFYGWQWILPPLFIWSIFWKGYALWTASKRDEKWWFAALLIINTSGLLEIFYLLVIAKVFTQEKIKSKRRRS